MQDTHQPLYPGHFYHVYNRGNNRENLFYTARNYSYFLTKYDFYLNDYIETYTYCLLPNHFHLLIRVRDKDIPGFKNPECLPATVSRQFSKFFNAYAKAINKQENRVGSLFQKNFKRLHIKNEVYLINLLYYIHANPQLHGLINDFRKWPYSSYDKFFNLKKTHLKKKEVLSWFGSTKEYEIYHATMQKMINIKQFLIDE